MHAKIDMIRFSPSLGVMAAEGDCLTGKVASWANAHQASE